MRNTSASVTLRNEYVLERIKDIKAPPYKDSVIMPAHIAHQNLECDQHT